MKTLAQPEPENAGPRIANTAFGCPRDFAGRQFIYTVISARARGLSVGVDMNPDKRCNFDCAYCEVNRQVPGAATLDVEEMARELEAVLVQARDGGLRTRPCYSVAAPELLQLRQVALSGDGEPTLCPNFDAAVEAVVHLRACGRFPFFKLVLITNASGLGLPAVQAGLRMFTRRDEIWAKLDVGSQAHMNRVNRAVPEVSLDTVLAGILGMARQRPVIIQSLFPALGGAGPSPAEVLAYVERLKWLKESGAQIPLVQIYSASRPAVLSDCGHLPLRTLSGIAQQVRAEAGLAAEVF